MDKTPTRNATAHERVVVSETDASDASDETCLRQAARLTLAVFNHSVAPLMDADGVRHFTEYAAAETWLQRQREGHRTWLARQGKRIVGVAHVRDGTHLSLLFVARRHQGQGVARALITALADTLGVDRLTVNASPNAVEAYQHLGFVAQGPEDKKSGIRYTPMLLTLNRPKSRKTTHTAKPTENQRPGARRRY